jgi:hypothetical protein
MRLHWMNSPFYTKLLFKIYYKVSLNIIKLRWYNQLILTAFYIEILHTKCYEKLDNLTIKEPNELLKREIMGIVIELILLSTEHYQSFNNSNS